MGDYKDEEENKDDETVVSTQVVLQEWYCHCCTKKNTSDVKKCVVCGRGDDYANPGFPLPLHGYGSQIFRANQVEKVLPDPWEADESGWTPLHSVASTGNGDLVRKLIDMESELEALTEHGETPLHLACYSGNLDCVKMLIEAGSDLSARTSFEKKQPIHFVCEGGWGKILKYILAHGADVNSMNACERRPLHNVAVIGRVDMAADLLRHGAEPDALDMGGWTARQMAELNNNRDVVELLCQAGMEEKMPVIKELPHAPWHGPVWDSLTEKQNERKERAKKEKQQWDHLHSHLEKLRQERLERDRGTLLKRRAEMEEAKRKAREAAAAAEAEEEMKAKALMNK